MRRVELALSRIADPAVRESFEILADEVVDSPFSGFRGKHFEISRVAGTYRYPHRLGYRPKDVIQTHLTVRTGTCTWVWNYDDFDSEHVYFTVTSSVASELVTVRAFIGSHREE